MKYRQKNRYRTIEQNEYKQLGKKTGKKARKIHTLSLRRSQIY